MTRAYTSQHNFKLCGSTNRSIVIVYLFALSVLLIAGGCASTADHAESSQATQPGSSPQRTAIWKIAHDDWYTLTIGGASAGWMRIVREDDGSRFRTVNEVRMYLEHGDAKLDTHNFMEWIESHAGQPEQVRVAKRSTTPPIDDNLSVWELTRHDDKHGLLTSSRVWEFDGKHARKVVQAADGKTVTTTHPIPAAGVTGWLPPVAAERLIRDRIAEDAPTIEYTILQASDDLKMVSVRSARVGVSAFRLASRRVPVTVWQTQARIEDAQAMSHYSSDGKLLYSVSDIGIGLLETRLSSREVALGKTELHVDSHLPRGSVVQIKLDQPLIATSRAEFELHTTEAHLPQLPSAGAQRVQPTDNDRTVRMTIDISASSEASAVELADARLRDGAPVLAGDHPLSVELAARAMRETKGLNSLDLAESSRAVVQRHFSQGALAAPTGAEAAVSRDPSGIDRARMLTAVLRAHRIHSRLVSGLAYRPQSATQPTGAGLFTLRVWNQALIDGRWLDFDSCEASRFTPGHILLDYAAPSDAGIAANPADFAEILSTVQIRVLSQE